MQGRKFGLLVLGMVMGLSFVLSTPLLGKNQKGDPSSLSHQVTNIFGKVGTIYKNVIVPVVYKSNGIPASIEEVNILKGNRSKHYYIEYISLQKYKQLFGIEEIPTEEIDCIEGIFVYDPYKTKTYGERTQEFNVKMGKEAAQSGTLEELFNMAKAGDIILNNDTGRTFGGSLFYLHSMLETESDSVIEALPNLVIETPNADVINRISKEPVTTVALLEVNVKNSSHRTDAVTYAKKQKGEPYLILALKKDPYSHSCSQLDWQSYWYKNRYDIDYDGGLYVTPDQIYLDNDITLLSSWNKKITLTLDAAGVQGETSVYVNGTAIGTLLINGNVPGYLTNTFNVDPNLLHEGNNEIYIPAPYSTSDDVYDDIQIRNIRLSANILLDKEAEANLISEDGSVYHIGDQTVAQITESYNDGNWLDPNPPSFWTALIGSSLTVNFKYPPATNHIATSLIGGNEVQVFHNTATKQSQ